MATNSTDSHKEVNKNPATRGNEEIPRLSNSISSGCDGNFTQKEDRKPNFDRNRKISNSKEMKSCFSQKGSNTSYSTGSRNGDIDEDLLTGMKKIKLGDDDRHNTSGNYTHAVNSNSRQKAGGYENDPVRQSSLVKSKEKNVRKADSEEEMYCRCKSSITIGGDYSSIPKKDNEKTYKKSNNDVGSKKERDKNSASSQNISIGRNYRGDNNSHDYDSKVRDKEHGACSVSSLRNAASGNKNTENKPNKSGHHGNDRNMRSPSRGAGKGASRSNSRNSRKSTSNRCKSRIGKDTRMNISRSSSSYNDSSSSGCSSTRESSRGSKGKGSHRGGTNKSNSQSNVKSVRKRHSSNSSSSSNGTTRNRPRNPSYSRTSKQNTGYFSNSNSKLSRNGNQGAMNRDEENSINDPTSSKSSISREEPYVQNVQSAKSSRQINKYEIKSTREKSRDRRSLQQKKYEEQEDNEEHEEEEQNRDEEEEKKSKVEYTARYSSDMTKSLADQQSRGRSKGGGTSSLNKEYPPSPIVPQNFHIQHKWQFKGYYGWTNYAQVPSNINYSGAKTATSDDIELYYLTDEDKCPLLIEVNNVQFILDFQNMTQTNQKTLSRLSIRRININEMDDPFGRWQVSTPNAAENADWASNTRTTDPQDNYDQHRSPDMSRNHSSEKVEWQFEDEFGNWVTYGMSMAYIGAQTATSSDDIEKVFSGDPNKAILRINFYKRQYILDFRTMIQTNLTTQVQRRVRRVPQQPAEKGWPVDKDKIFVGDLIVPGKELSQFEWQFMDEHSAWITYGQTNTAGMAHCATTVTSEDIDKYFNSSPKKVIMTIMSRSNCYVLDFTEMIQINKATSVQRPIRRIPKVIRGNKPPSNGGPSRGAAANYNSASIGPSPAAHRSVGGSGTVSTTQIGWVSPITNYGHGASNIPHGHINHSNRSASSIPHVWQFQDGRGAWITYGKASTTGNWSRITSESSADIEKHWRKFKGNRQMKVKHSRGVYLLDFKNMVQMNEKTGTTRNIHRIPIQ